VKNRPAQVNETLQSLPHNPGVYQFFDEEDVLIYIGKAKNLKKRVSSYFSKEKYDSGKTALLVRKIESIKFILVETEFDALLLENTLIKKHQPRFNIQLRDDKTFPWICLKKERFPRVFSTRILTKDGSEYFGPYASVKVMNALLELIKKLYHVRTCNYNLSQENIDAEKFKVCLEFHIGNCLGPCEGRQSEADYNESIANIRQIIKGNAGEVIRHFSLQMTAAAERLEFEHAQMIKTKIDLLARYQSRSTVVNPAINNVDVFSIVGDDKYGYVNFMKIANGSVIQSHTVEMKKKLEETPEELLKMAILEIRQRFNSTSEEIFTSIPLDLEMPGTTMYQPQRGDKKKLIDLSLRNVKYFMLERHKAQEKVDPNRHSNRILKQLQKDMRMLELPTHIECFDNSNLQGTNPVAACVVFKNARPSKKDYRHFNIKTVVGPDDFASMEEVVYRRYSRLQTEGEPLPQLIVIDGGKGQLSAAVKSLEKLGLRGKINIIGIAKKLEEIFFPGDSVPLYIDKRSESLKLIQNLRNEAHRFGITHHRNKRSKATIRTELSEIKGIGAQTASDLLRHFKSVKRIKEASLKELTAAIPASRAQLVYAHFQEKANS